MSGPGPQGSGNGRVGIVEGWELRQRHKREANSGAFKGLVFVVVALLLVVVGGWFAARPMVGPFLTDVFQGSPGVINLPLAGDLIAAEFADRLDKPAGETEEEIEFAIEPGQTIDEIQANLVVAGLLDDEPAFKYAVVRDRVDQLIKAGTYTMTPRITPAGIAARLQGDPDPPPQVVTLDMRHGRRIEQIVAYLVQETKDSDLELDPKEFLRLARNPSANLRKQFSFLKQSPEGSSLEGFLYGGTYEVAADITPDELIRAMLKRWDDAASTYVAQSRKQGKTFYDVLKVASLVEREAKADSDRRKIAGVYWNRLNPKVNKQTDGLLQADPTVVYATDSMALEDRAVNKWDGFVFWDLLGLSDYSTVNVDKKYQSYQTYQDPGLPDGPIVTPSAKSLAAALSPNLKAKNLFFYACPGSDTHKFAKNFKQHQRNIKNCK